MNIPCHLTVLCIILSIFALGAQVPSIPIPCLSTQNISCPGGNESKMIIAITGKNTRMNITREFYTLPSNYNSNFVDMGDGQTYTGSKNGITMWDSYASLEITTENSRIPENHVTALALDADNNLWIGTCDKGIVIGVQKGIRPFKVQKVITRDQHISSIYVDEKKLVWVAYRNGNLECFSHGVSCAYFPVRKPDH